MEQLIAIITQVGFPIVAFLLMYQMNRTTIKDNTTALKELKEVMKYLKR